MVFCFDLPTPIHLTTLNANNFKANFQPLNLHQKVDKLKLKLQLSGGRLSESL